MNWETRHWYLRIWTSFKSAFSLLNHRLRLLGKVLTYPSMSISFAIVQLKRIKEKKNYTIYTFAVWSRPCVVCLRNSILNIPFSMYGYNKETHLSCRSGNRSIVVCIWTNFLSSQGQFHAVHRDSISSFVIVHQYMVLCWADHHLQWYMRRSPESHSQTCWLECHSIIPPLFREQVLPKFTSRSEIKTALKMRAE